MKTFSVTMKIGLFGIVLLLFTMRIAVAAPVTVNGDPFTLVATGPGTAQLGLTSNAQGRIYIGNNANNTIGIPVQRFDLSLFSGVPIATQAFGPAVGDADGLAAGGGFVFVGDQNEGLRRITISDQTSSILVAGVGINGTGSPVAYRPSDGHVFVGFGATVPEAQGQNRIDEYNAAGGLVQTFTTTAEPETMTFNPISGLIYYADFDTQVRSFNPLTGADLAVGNSSGTIDGGLAFDSISGKIFVGTANGVNSGRVETIDPLTGLTQLFATGFDGSLGILREPVSGDLYFLESNQLYRIEAIHVPEPATVALTGIAIPVLFGSAIRRRWRASRVASERG